MALAKDIRSLINKYKGPTPPKVYDKNVKRLLKGSLILFRYSNPKYKKVLKYYDARPFAMIFDYNAKYLIGVNMHFIPWTYRQQLVGILIKRLKYKNRLKYSDIKKAAETVRMPHVYMVFAIRKYIRSRIGSKLYSFTHDNYKLATQNIPPNFKKEQDKYIMRDINRMVRELRASKKLKK
jgi:hypothetical protein